MSSQTNTTSWADAQDDIYIPSIVDQNEELDCFHFDQCDINSSDCVKQFRGVIKTKEGIAVCKTFDFTPEIVETDIETIKKYEHLILNSRCFLSYEATLLRVFYHKDKWYLTTCRKLDAFKSRWGLGQTFGDLFIEELRKIVSDDVHKIYKETNPYSPSEVLLQSWANETLEKSNVYCFLIRTYVDNRIVCQGYEKANLFCIGWFSSINHSFTHNQTPSIGQLVEEVNLGVDYSLDHVLNYMKTLDYKKIQGLIFINDEGKCFKILIQEYDRLNRLRANQPNILLRYIELQQEGDVERVQDFVQLYQDKRNIFIEFQDAVDDICLNIFRKYRNRFVRKMVSIAPPEQYYIIRELHEQFLADRTNVVTPERVQAHVHSLEPLKLLGLYKMYVKRKELTGFGNKLPQDLKDKVSQQIFTN